jgi:hypothetical protein
LWNPHPEENYNEKNNKEEKKGNCAADFTTTIKFPRKTLPISWSQPWKVSLHTSWDPNV